MTQPHALEDWLALLQAQRIDYQPRRSSHAGCDYYDSYYEGSCALLRAWRADNVGTKQSQDQIMPTICWHGDLLLAACYHRRER